MYVIVSPLDRLVSFIIHNTISDEVWKEITETKNELYFISNYGRVLSLWERIPKLKSIELNSNGYQYVQLQTILDDGTTKSIHYSISHLVAKYFIGDIPKDYIVHHKNLVRTDNKYTNLLIMSSKEHIELHNKIRSEQKNDTIKDNSRAGSIDAT